MNGTHFAIDGSNQAYSFNKNKRIDKEFAIKSFINNCASKDVKNVFCQVDRDSNDQVKEGMTTFGVETSDKNLTTIAIFESNYGVCKDEMNVLKSAVNQAQARIDRKNSIKAKIVLGVTATALIAGGIKLYHDHHNTKAPVEEPTTIETTVETTESKTEPLTGADFIRYSQEQHINEHAEQQKEELAELRNSYLDEYRVPSTGTIPEVQQPEVQIPEATAYSYSFNDVVDNAEATKASIDEFNSNQSQQQAEYVKQLRQSYTDEYSSGYTK